MKVLGINGSPNEKGVTYTAMSIVGQELEKEGIELEIIHIGKKPIQSCIDCRKCVETKRCVFQDQVNEVLDKMDEYCGLLIGAPTHYMGIPGALKAFLDRFMYASNRLIGHSYMPAAGIAISRRAGAVNTLHQLDNYFHCSSMVTVNSLYWNIAFGWTPEEFLARDAEGIQTMQVLGKNMAWLIKVIAASKDTLPPPEIPEPRIKTSFCSNWQSEERL